MSLSYESSGVNYDQLDAFKRACQKAAKTTAPLLRYAERIFSRPAYIEALTPSEKVMRR